VAIVLNEKGRIDMRVLAILVSVIALMALVACNSIHYVSKDGEVSMGPAKGKVVSSATASGKASSYFFSIFPGTVSVDKELGAGKKYGNVVIRQKTGFFDPILSMLTLQMLTFNSYEITADVIE